MEACKARDLLLANNIKITEQRLTILEEIISIKEPFNANYLHDRVTSKLAVDLATVYRVINTLIKFNVIREVMTLDGFQYYEMSCIHNPVHPHFFCEKCHKIICLDAISFDDSLQLIKLVKGNSVKTISINLTGICKECNKVL